MDTGTASDDSDAGVTVDGESLNIQSVDADCSCDDKMTRRYARAAILTNHAG